MENYDPRRRNDEERRQARSEDRGRDRDSWWRDRPNDDQPRRAERGWLDYDRDYGRSGERQGGRDEQRYGRGGGDERSSFSPDWSREGEQPRHSDEPYYARNRERQDDQEGSSRGRSMSRQRGDDYYDPDWPYARSEGGRDLQRSREDEQDSHYRGYYSRSGGPFSYPGGKGYLYAESLTLHGPYTGRGPKGYKRSDQQIMEEACQRLERDGEIDASDIEVTAEEGVIRLRGTVQDRRTKRRAEECVESIYGARDVMNELRVSQQSQQGGEQSRGAQSSLGLQSGQGSQQSQGSQASGSQAAGSQPSSTPGMRQGTGSQGSEQAGDEKRSPRH